MNLFFIKIEKGFNFLFLITLCIITYYLLSPFEIWNWDIILHDVEKKALGAQLTLILIAYLFFKVIVGEITIRFTILDFSLILYIGYLIFHAAVLKPINPDPIFIVENILLFTIYIGYRSIPRRQLIYIYWIFIFAGLHQIYFGILKQTGGFSPGYGLSDIKGSFINQGPFAGFIACLVFITSGLFLNTFKGIYINNLIKKWVIRFLYVVILIILLIIIIYSNSRAAWLATLAGLLFYTWKTYNIGLWLKNVLNSSKVKFVFYVVIVVFTIGVVYSLYHYKKDSADGRILIWKTTLEMISNKPIFGHGINTFQSNYMLYQESYFKENKDNPYQYLASDNNYAFNEFLRIGSEQGLIGVLMVSILGYFIKKKGDQINRDYLDLISLSGLILILVFGLFSYPNEILPIKIIFIFFIAILSKSSKVFFEIPRISFQEVNNQFIRNVKRTVFLILVFIAVLFSWKITNNTFKIYKDWNFALLEMKKGSYNEYIVFSEKKYQKLKSNGYFLGFYGKSLLNEQKYNKAINIFEQAILLIPSSKIYIDIGKCYKNIGNYNEAEVYWIKAANMVPAQFYPEYLIAKMYFENGQKGEAKKIASDLISNKKIKVYSIEVHQIIEELRKIVDEP